MSKHTNTRSDNASAAHEPGRGIVARYFVNIDIETCGACGGEVKIIPKALALLAGQALASIA